MNHPDTVGNRREKATLKQNQLPKGCYTKLRKSKTLFAMNCADGEQKSPMRTIYSQNTVRKIVRSKDCKERRKACNIKNRNN